MIENNIREIKESLLDTVDSISSNPTLFLSNPEKDFTRKRKLDLKTTLNFILNMSGGSINKELLDYFEYDNSLPSNSAFIQQRAKILPELFGFLFHEFTSKLNLNKTFHGYRLIACDGSNIPISSNPKDTETVVNSGKHTTRNSLHLNAFYDIMNRIYLDVTIQTFAEKNEFYACRQMIKRSEIEEKVILIADRGYENYNIFANAEKKNWKYLFRVKDINSNGILSGLKIDEEGSFDKNFSLTFTRSKTKEKNALRYKFMPTNQIFDYLPVGSMEEYTLKFRVVRFPISENRYESIITNLGEDEFSPKDIKEMYNLRWGIETSFRELKYAIGLANLHSKKVDYIKQEIFARLVNTTIVKLLLVIY